MASPIWLVNLLKKGFPRRFAIARLTRYPVLGKVIDDLIFKGDRVIFLPKDRVVEVNRPVDAPGEMVLPSRVVEYFIEKANYHWIMDRCICRDATGCRDYPVELGCLFLGEAAMGINPVLGRSVIREEALDHVRRCREAGLVHMVGRTRLDSLWLNVGPGNRLLTICSCCPCCCMWRILPHLDAGIGSNVTKMTGVSVTVGEECVGCGTCAQGICFADAIRVEGGRAMIGEACRGCGQCVEACPHGVIELSIGHDLFVDDSIGRIAPLVNVE